MIILLFVAIAGKSQENGTLSLFSDRDTYTSGETLLFKVFTDSKNQSGVVHLSLINARGKTITEVNKKITQYQADGFIYIPDSLKTGTYLLCVSDHINPFTTVKELFICNRFSGLNETTSILRAPEPGPMTKDQAEIKIAGLGKNLKTREKVTLSIQLPMEMTEVRNENLLISVSRISPGFASRTFVMKNPLNGNREGEKSGVILEGYAKDPATNAPFNKACILLSVADSIPGIQY